jgi:hypothetical protein
MWHFTTTKASASDNAAVSSEQAWSCLIVLLFFLLGFPLLILCRLIFDPRFYSFL